MNWNKVYDVGFAICMISAYALVLIIVGLCLVETFSPKSLIQFFWQFWSILASI